MKIDSHQHFWRYTENKFPWMNDQLGILKQNYLPNDLKLLLESIGFDGSIVIQVEQNIQETEWLLELATLHSFIKGVVGWVPLSSPTVEKDLAIFSKHPAFVGIRHMIHDEPDDNFMLRTDFQNGIAQLQKFNLAYDLLLHPRHLLVAAKLVEKFPLQRFVVDHIAKPKINEKIFSPWKDDLANLAKLPNVFCKLSGMVTETKWQQWNPEDFHAYLDIVINLFGTDRVMIGSDWPVCNLSGNYQTVMNIVINYIQSFSTVEKEAILGKNCMQFYDIKR